MRIHALPTQLVNQITTDKIVERPTSMIKKLIKNYFDTVLFDVDMDLGGARIKIVFY